MAQRVGDDNIFIFGLTSDEVNEIWSSGYNSSAYYNQNQSMRKIIESLIVGFNGTSFADIANYLLRNAPVADPYMCLADYESYATTQDMMSRLYRDEKMAWNRKSLMNIAASGYFSADRSVRDYAHEIWGLKAIVK